MTDTKSRPPLTIVLAAPRGFCAGVDRAIQIVEGALDKWGAPVYVRHEIVHNRHVVESLEAKGAVFVEELDDCPIDRPVVFSAHGVTKSVPAEASRRNMIYVDATCPLVSKVHLEADRLHKKDHHILLIGHEGNPEVIGTMGQLPEGAISLIEDEAQAEAFSAPDDRPLAFVTQTTLSVDDTAKIVEVLRRRFPEIAAPKKEDICYATTNRQEAVKAIAADVLKYRGVEINPDNIVVMPGGKPTMFFAILMFGEPGTEIMYPNPGFPIYESVIRFSGATPVPIELHESSGFSFSADDVLARITDKTRLIIVNTPANPTGGIVKKEELNKFAKGLENFPHVAVL